MSECHLTHSHNNDLLVLDNEMSNEQKREVMDELEIKCQLPNNCTQVQSSQEYDQDIQGAILSIFVRIGQDFPQFICNLLMNQTELTLNHLYQSTINSTLSTGISHAIFNALPLLCFPP